MVLTQEALVATNFFFSGQKGFYRGKVRDVYDIKDKYLMIVASDRISAFDHVLPRAIPYKGQVLNQVAAHFLQASRHVCPNWFIESPDPNVTVGLKCEPLKVEMVIRGYLAGHSARMYTLGNREICGNKLPEGMRENDRFAEPIITPTTKAAKGHDLDITKDDIIKEGIVDAAIYEQVEDYTHRLFAFGTEIAAKNGLLLVDTKYEFGILDGQVYLMDEVHTPDSSRYFYAEGYQDRQNSGEVQTQLSKEFVRQWLIENGFQGRDSEVIPEMDDEMTTRISERYIELYERVTGLSFVKTDYNGAPFRIEENINAWLKKSGT